MVLSYRCLCEHLAAWFRASVLEVSHRPVVKGSKLTLSLEEEK